MKGLFQSIAAFLIARAQQRTPDFVIGGSDDPYLRRWWVLPRNPLFNIYLHQVLRSDDDRALHCHPWCNASIILSGAYTERVPVDQSQASGFDYVRGFTRDIVRQAGKVTFRFGRWRHRLIVADGGECWTLFITGPVYRRWGFWCRTGWIYWKDFVNDRDKGQVGKGCGT